MLERVMEDTALILDDLKDACRELFGLNIHQATPIMRGWLNLKWKITTDSGEFLVKQYNKERYKLYAKGDLRRALSEQQRLHRAGFPCPRLLEVNNHIMQVSRNGEVFAVMEYCQGETCAPGSVNELQMMDLGKITGTMHSQLNDGTLGAKEKTQFMPPSKEARVTHWNHVYDCAISSRRTDLLPYIDRQRLTTESLEWDTTATCQTGWAHRDLWVDNILMQPSCVSAVLDFDRLRYDYPELDVARAIMSCAWSKDGLNIPLTAAFLEGYRSTYSFPVGQLETSLRMLWYMESTWWITADTTIESSSLPPTRFALEMHWLAQQDKALKQLVSKL